MNFSSLKKAVGKAYETAASTAGTVAKDIQSQVIGAKCLRDYNLQRQIATGGLHGLWKIFMARSKKDGAQNKVVGVWILDKRAPASFGGGRWETVVDLCRKEASALTRLKHPSIIKILEPMEESRTQLIMVTEAIFASTMDLLTKFENVPGHRQQVRLSELDVKAGLLQVAGGLQFLHHEANLVHRGISPGVVMLTESGAWKLSGLGLAVRAQFAGANEAATLTFDYSNPSPPSSLQLTQAPLAYVAPELISQLNQSSSSSLITPAADIFSLGALVYELVSGVQLFQVGNNLGSYQAKLASLHVMDLTGIPIPLQPTLKSMLSPQASVRPNANAFTGAPYFQDDVVVRALRFLENFLQRDALQKASFLNDLEGLWSRCDSRVLRYRVLPPLLAESRNEALQPVVLPLVMRIIQKQESQDFSDFVLPSLLPVFTSANGPALFQLTKYADILYTVMSPQAVSEVLIPLLCRASDLGDVRTQEEMLNKSQGLAEKAYYSSLKAQILPRAQRLCLATTSAGVRQASFRALTSLAPRFDKEVASEFITTTQQVLKVDRSNGTVSGALGLGKALVSTWGPIFGAEAVLPVLSPCLAAPGLSREQFREVYKAIEDILHSIASSRANNIDEEQPRPNTNVTNIESLPSWDEGPSMSSPSLENSPRIQNIHAQVPKRKSTNSAHTLRPNTSQTNGSGNASWDKGQGKTLENQADPFSMTPVNQASQTSGSTLSWPSQKNPEPKSVLQDFSTFQPLDVTRSSRQAQEGQNPFTASESVVRGLNQNTAKISISDPNDPFKDWPPASQNNRLALAGITPSQPSSNFGQNSSLRQNSGNDSSLQTDFAPWPQGNNQSTAINQNISDLSSTWPSDFSQPQPGNSQVNSGQNVRPMRGRGRGNAMKPPKLAPPPMKINQASNTNSTQNPPFQPKDPFSDSLI